jgi:Acetyltransferase (GNAT) domain
LTLVARQAQVLHAADSSHLSSWNQLVNLAPVSDVYYRPGYALAYEAAGHGKAIAVILTSDRGQVLMPLLLQRLSDLPFGQNESGFDAVTPYGYGGLLPLSEEETRCEFEAHALMDAIQRWCRESNVISCHIRLHPILEQDKWLNAVRFQDEAVSLRFRTLTTAVDLSKWDNAGQRIAGMSAARRLKLNRARRSLRVLWSGVDIPMDEAIRLFRIVYEYRMTQVHASPYYYFPQEYYSALAKRTILAVALAWWNDELVGGHLYLADGPFAHYHLGGTNDLGFKFAASTLLTNAGAKWAREHGCKILHLGGGNFNSDSLFDFKRSFGGDVYRYHTLDVIADESRYRSLVKKRIKYGPPPRARQDFFPQYRA